MDRIQIKDTMEKDLTFGFKKSLIKHSQEVGKYRIGGIYKVVDQNGRDLKMTMLIDSSKKILKKDVPPEMKTEVNEFVKPEDKVELINFKINRE